MAYIEKASLTIEEAREILPHRLRERSVELSISNLVLPGMELNLYGANDEICIIGEASTRAGASIINSRKNTFKTICTMQATPAATEAAKSNGIWLLKAVEDLVPPPI